MASLSSTDVSEGGNQNKSVGGPVTRTPANVAALRLNLTVQVISNLSNAAIFPFFALVAAKKTSSETVVGAIFASNPLAMCITSIATPWLSKRFGRIRVLSCGLVGGMVGLVGFGVVESIWAWFLFRALHGSSSALVDGPAGALLLAHSSDIAEDLGLSEAAAGLTYMIGPAAGGAIFAAFGLRGTFIVLASLYGFAFLLLPFTIRGLPALPAAAGVEVDGNEKEEKNTTLDSLEEEDGEGLMPDDANNDDDEQGAATTIKPWAILGAERAVWLGGFVNVFMFASTTFYDIALPAHLKATLGLGARGRGFIYFVPAFVYMCLSPWLGTLCRFAGPRNVLLTGLLVCGCVFLICGPAPPLAAFAREHLAEDPKEEEEGGEGGGDSGSGGGRSFAWVCTCLAMAVWGFGLCPGFQASLPLMDGALKATALKIKNQAAATEEGAKAPLTEQTSSSSTSRSRSRRGARRRSSSNESGGKRRGGGGPRFERLQQQEGCLGDDEERGGGVDEEMKGEEERNDDDCGGGDGRNSKPRETLPLSPLTKLEKETKAAVEDALSAMVQATAAAGQIAGPILGGLGLQMLPQIRDIGCYDDGYHGEDNDLDSLSGPIDTGDVVVVDESGNGSDGEFEEEDVCVSGFSWSTMLLSAIFFFAAAVTATLPDTRQKEEEEREEEEEEKEEGEGGEGSRTNGCYGDVKDHDDDHGDGNVEAKPEDSAEKTKEAVVFAVAGGALKNVEQKDRDLGGGVSAMSVRGAADRRARYLKKATQHQHHQGSYGQVPLQGGGAAHSAWSPIHDADCNEGIEF